MSQPSKLDTICGECPLARSRRVAFGGPLDAEVVIVGQSPGSDEEKVGRPFVGSSGKLLRRALREAGFDEAGILFTNAVQCRSAGDPTRELIDRCRPYLAAIISHAPRKLIIALGNEAWYSLHGGRLGGVTKHVGEVKDSEEFGCPMFWNLHPAYLLRRNLEGVGAWTSQLARAYGLYMGTGRTLEVDPEIVAPGYLSVDHLSADHWALTEPVCTCDVETTGLDFMVNEVLGVGLAAVDGRTIYICWTHGPEHLLDSKLITGRWVVPAFDDPARQHIVSWLSAVIGQQRAPERFVAMHHGKFDVKMLIHRLTVDPRPVSFDTMLVHHLVDENEPHGLKPIGQTWLGLNPWETEAKAHLDQGGGHHLGELPIETLAHYCACDALVTAQLIKPLSQRMVDEGLQNIYEGVVRPLSDMLVDIELRGMVVDRAALSAATKALGEATVAARERVCDLSPIDDINPRSRLDVCRILYGEDGYGIQATRRSKRTGDPSVDEETLLSLAEGRPVSYRDANGQWHNNQQIAVPAAAKRFIEGLLAYRGVDGLHSRFAKGIEKHIRQDGAVHTSFLFNPESEDSPRTGRLSSSAPNIQNIKKELRPVFSARPGYALWDGDLSQIEVRVWAYLSQDPALLTMFEHATTDPSFDYHRIIAAVCWEIKPEEVTPEQRNASKVITFGGLMYGGEEAVVAKEMHLPIGEVKQLMQRLYRTFPIGQRWLQSQVMFAREHGYVVSPLGRRRRLPGINSRDKGMREGAERQAKNSPIQGMASDINNIGGLRIHRHVREEGVDAYCLNLVHDALLWEVDEGVVQEQDPIFRDLLTRSPFRGFNVPLQCEATISKHWAGELDVAAVIKPSKEVEALAAQRGS